MIIYSSLWEIVNTMSGFKTKSMLINNKNIRAMKTIKKLTEKEVVLNRLTQSMLVIYLLNDNANTRIDDTPRLSGNL